MEVNQMSLLRGKEYAYEYLVGCKTGYTNAARSSLVSCAGKDGLKLICVVLRDEAPYQYEDTLALFEYGFSNFRKLNVAENDTKYNMDAHGLFYSDNDVLGNSKPILSLNTEDYLILPNTVSFEDLHSTLCYDTDTELQAAIVTYTYQDWPVGSASIDFTGDLENNYEFDSAEDMNAFTSPSPENPTSDPIPSDVPAGKSTSAFAKVLKWCLIILLTLLIVCALLIGILFIRRTIIIRRRRKRRQYRTPSINLDGNASCYRSRISEAKRRQRAAKRRRKRSRW